MQACIETRNEERLPNVAEVASVTIGGVSQTSLEIAPRSAASSRNRAELANIAFRFSRLRLKLPKQQYGGEVCGWTPLLTCRTGGDWHRCPPFSKSNHRVYVGAAPRRGSRTLGERGTRCVQHAILDSPRSGDAWAPLKRPSDSGSTRPPFARRHGADCAPLVHS